MSRGPLSSRVASILEGYIKNLLIFINHLIIKDPCKVMFTFKLLCCTIFRYLWLELHTVCKKYKQMVSCWQHTDLVHTCVTDQFVTLIVYNCSAEVYKQFVNCHKRTAWRNLASDLLTHNGGLECLNNYRMNAIKQWFQTYLT